MLDLVENLDNYMLTALFYLVVAILTLTLWRCWKVCRPVSYGSLIVLIFAISYRWWYFQFDSQRWLRSSERDRYPMVNNLVERKILSGKGRQQVIQLLGPPYQPFFDPKDEMIYRVFGGDQTKLGEPIACKITILLDKQQRATFVQLHAPYGKEVSRLP